MAWLLDTSFPVALYHANDRYHAKAIALAREIEATGTQLVVHWGVLLEIGDGFARLRRRDKGREILTKLLTEDGYDIILPTKADCEDAYRLFMTRPDKEWGLTDCVSFIIMRRLGLDAALTADQHFRQAGFKALLLD